MMEARQPATNGTGSAPCTRSSWRRSGTARASSPPSTRAGAARRRRCSSTASTRTPTRTTTRCSTASTRCAPASSPARASPATGSSARSSSRQTMDREIEGRDIGDYLWSVKGVVPFLKVDKGLADEADGAQVMKPMPGLDELLDRAVAKGVFGTKMRSVIKLADADRRRRRRRPAVRGRPPDPRPPASCRSSSPRSTSTARRRPRPRRSSRRRILAPARRRSPADQPVMLKLTLPEADGFYADLVAHPNVRPGRRALRRLQPRRGQRPPRPQPGRDRQLLPGPHRGADGRAERRGVRRRPRRRDQGHLRGLDHLAQPAPGKVDGGLGPPQRRGGRSPGGGPTLSDTAERRALGTAPSGSTGSSSASPATPATACSSPATASPAPARCSATTSSTLPDFPAEIRAPAGTLAGVSAFQVHISDHDITTPGDAPNVLVAMNPAALRSRAAPPRARRHADRQHRHLRRAQPHQGRLRRQPAHRRQPRRLHGLRGADDEPHQGRGRAARREAPRRRAVEELLRPRPRVVDVHPAGRADTLDWIEEQVRRQAAGARRQPRRLQGRPRLRRDRRAVRPPLRGQARPRCRRAPTRTSTATPRWRGASSPPASCRRLPLFLGCYPITPASDILHELSKHKNFGVRTLQAEDEIAGIGAAHRRRLRRPPRRHHHERAGRRPQGARRWAWPSASSCRCSSSTSSGAVRPPACPPRPRRPTCCMAMYGRHGESPLPIVAAHSPSALLRRRHRGGPHRAQVPHAGDPAVRRLPRQRLRAVAAARRRRPARHLRHVRHRAQPHRRRRRRRCSGPTSATPTPSPGRGPCPARPASCTASAASRRRTAPATSATTPTNHERMVHLRAAKVAGIADDIPPVEVDGDVDDAELLVLGWGSTWGAIDGAVDRRAGPRAARSPTPTSPTSTRSPPTSARCCAATRGCWCPR